MTLVAAVVVTYHPSGPYVDRLQRLAAQVDRLIIVDNHSLPEVVDTLTRFCFGDDHRKLICNYENFGIAQALNIGIEAARQMGMQWVLTMDQDSIVEPDLVRELLQTIEQDRQSETAGVVAANYEDSTGRPYVKTTDEQGSDSAFETRTAITSGSLVNVAAWQAVGGYREDFFIDSVDHDFCFRVRKAGWRILQSRRVLMKHQLGGTTRRANWLVVKPAIANYGPIRRYYMSRNRVAMFKSHWKSDLGWVLRELLMIPIDMMLILVHEPGKAVKIGAMIKGVWHGVIGRMGRFEPLLIPRT